MPLRKKLDARIKTLIDNGRINNHRSFLVIVGDKGKDQVINLHHMLTKATVGTQPSVLWCYKKELGFTTHRQKRIKQIKRKQRQGLLDPNKEDAFELFLTTANVRWTYYKDSHKVLGNTYGMCVLQDFEAITPNILARTIETVSGGGLVILLLKTMQSLKQLYSVSMDMHNKFRTEAHGEVKPRFNERFLLSLISCKSSLLLDDELNILPISEASRNIVPVPPKEGESAEAGELASLKESLKETEMIGPLLEKAKTLDQAKALINFFEAISERTLRSTVALTAARGRGKSAALGLAMASAVAYGYSNIFVTSPSPENLKTLFEFIFVGFDALGYQEHTDYELIRSTNPLHENVIVRVNIFRSHRQVIQYIAPDDHKKLGQAELVVIDEAAAIPLPYVRALLGPYLVFISSTVNGYEGTGRSLSLKLIKELRDQAGVRDKKGSSVGGRTFREIVLRDPIRYSNGDTVEQWLNQLLCLDCTETEEIKSLPHPDKCQLFYVDRDTLFSYHKVSEVFLQRVMSLYVSSHYKNSPNDLMLLSDAPAHHLFVLLPPTDENTRDLPNVLCVIQVCLEGEISKDSVLASVNKGKRPSGDLIPWNVNMQFQDDDFPSLSGARIVRIATHPNLQKAGYGTRAMELLTAYYEGKICDLSESNVPSASRADDEEYGELHSEKLAPRRGLPPLLQKLEDRPAEKLHYLGVSFGLTSSLFDFWKKSNFLPIYIRQSALATTGEHTAIMLKDLDSKLTKEVYDPNWLFSFYDDFCTRFLSLLGFGFKTFSVKTALTILSKPRSKMEIIEGKTKPFFGKRDAPEFDYHAVSRVFTHYDHKRLSAYSNNIIDFHAVLDLIPALAKFVFHEGLSEVLPLSPAQFCILLGVGLQFKSLEDVASELSLQNNQVMALFNKMVKKMVKLFSDLEETEEAKNMPELSSKEHALIERMQPTKMTLDEELEEAHRDSVTLLKDKQANLLASLVTPDFIIKGDEAAWESCTKDLHNKVPNIVSIKRKRGESELDYKKEDKHQNKKKRGSQKRDSRK
eukprot:TRINITY_DN12778_c0_g1_i1.p1 TRINITY_DN12778_c0_g1~~TRINITY_DN12778_c0_g1_i1.p1  ORF type:complete len:1030 (+),score=308.71 TRINITY_DN12778_c0_g1_i1:16-3105(+)